MAIKLVVLSLLVASAIFDVSSAAASRTVVGGWKSIKDPNHPKVQEIGKFAVAEYNKQAKAKLKFVKVVNGETQVVAGINYRLIIQSKDGAASRNYQAVVYERPWENLRNLISFKPV